MNAPKRLIEVDLPIKEISAHASREKSIRHGHLSTLHIWWARRPLAACRAVACAMLWPDPADERCPPSFTSTANEIILDWAINSQYNSNAKLFKKLGEIRVNPAILNDPVETRNVLLAFIADFSSWENSVNVDYLSISRKLTASAHSALFSGGSGKPLVVDPFAGGGSIPFESLRIGADSFASDINPIPILLNKVLTQLMPKYGTQLSVAIRESGEWIGHELKRRLSEYYQTGPGGHTSLAYIWARTISCEGPGCGAEVPLLRSLWMARRKGRSVALNLRGDLQGKKIDVRIIEQEQGGWEVHKNGRGTGEFLKDPSLTGTVKRGSVSCPCCGHTTPLIRVKEQLSRKAGGTRTSRIVAVILGRGQELLYRAPNEFDLKANDAAMREFDRVVLTKKGGINPIPDESTTGYHSFVNRGPLYGMNKWSDYFTPRQALAISTMVTLIDEAACNFRKNNDEGFSVALRTCLAFGMSKCIDYLNSCTNWMPRGTVGHLFSRQAIAMTWDFPEANPISDFHCAWSQAYEWPALVCDNIVKSTISIGHVEVASATKHPLPNESANAVFTDPPYYYSVQYSDLSDFFYVWLKRVLGDSYPALFATETTPKVDEIIVQSPGHEFAKDGKNREFFERMMTQAMAEAKRILHPDGIGVVVFAHTSTSGWESQLQAMINSGWILTASWPIDTERSARILAIDRSVLASSIHLVCRPRITKSGSIQDSIGDWRVVLSELPKRIHEWMPRLEQEGVVGADAIFACLGPALEIFSRYERVEKASGEAVPLSEYLVQVWSAVSREALALVLKGGDTAGFEEDARLTAMWLWTLQSGGGGDADDDTVEKDSDDPDEESNSASKLKGFSLEFDAARKIGQGLGCHLERLGSLVEIKGPVARLLSVDERAQHLWKVDKASLPKIETAPKKGRKAKSDAPGQLSLFDLVPGDKPAPTPEVEAVIRKVELKAGLTTLDRLHQAMLLFGAGRGEALKRFLVEDGVGKDERFWKLASALQPLYPLGTDERRWSEGVLARKKGLGF